MKKIFAIFVAMLFVASLSLAVVGCKKAEEPAAEAPKVEAPVAPSLHLQLLQYLHLQHRTCTRTCTCKIIASK